MIKRHNLLLKEFNYYIKVGGMMYQIYSIYHNVKHGYITLLTAQGNFLFDLSVSTFELTNREGLNLYFRKGLNLSLLRRNV